jgi:hypothetical protein
MKLNQKRINLKNQNRGTTYSFISHVRRSFFETKKGKEKLKEKQKDGSERDPKLTSTFKN